MEKIINNRRLEFQEYCLKNEKWLDNIELPIIKHSCKKETVIVELRELDHLYFIIRNTIRVLGIEWSHTIVCGENNYNFILNIVKRINRNIKIIKLVKYNLTRLEYSIMLLNSSFYQRFYGEYLLIYQEDTIIFRNIPDVFFKYDFIGAPIPKNDNLFNGGFSLRNKKKMIDICIYNYDYFQDRFSVSCRYLDKTIKLLKKHNLDYKKNKDLYFLYLIEKTLIEDILLCDKCLNIPTFKEANEFSVEKYYFQN